MSKSSLCAQLPRGRGNCLITAQTLHQYTFTPLNLSLSILNLIGVEAAVAGKGQAWEISLQGCIRLSKNPLH